MGAKSDDEVREFRLEGGAIFGVGAVIVLALIGTFFLGRWYERANRPPQPLGMSAEDPLAHVVPAERAVDVTQSATYFDEVGGGAEKQAEPQREVPPRPPPAQAQKAAAPPAEPASVAAPARSGPGGSGSYFVQVFAGRDRSAADGLLRKLEGEGFHVRLFAEPDGAGELVKVRVGGYATQDTARAAARELQGRGYSGAWVTRVE